MLGPLQSNRSLEAFIEEHANAVEQHLVVNVVICLYIPFLSGHVERQLVICDANEYMKECWGKIFQSCAAAARKHQQKAVWIFVIARSDFNPTSDAAWHWIPAWASIQLTKEIFHACEDKANSMDESRHVLPPWFWTAIHLLEHVGTFHLPYSWGSLGLFLDWACREQ